LSHDLKTKTPNAVNAYFSPVASTIYNKRPLWPDYRMLNRMAVLRCSTIKVHGQYMGVDKITHFTTMGTWYYSYYQWARSSGKSREEAISTARSIGQHGPISEHWLVGGIPAGIYSNADMAANYVGLLFYINVTEPVKIAGETRPPMVVREGDHWKLQPHVQPGYFAMFVSPHFDEVLNPCLYEWTFREQVRAAIGARREAILARYTRERPGAHSPQDFDNVFAYCQTYYGEDYGHSGQTEHLITVARTCFEQPSSRLQPTLGSENLVRISSLGTLP
jgi:hypothetical protein